MHKLTRARATVAVVLATAVGVVGPSSIFVGEVAAKPKHCVKYKMVKGKNGKMIKRCAKYSK
jgi:hypothetical protein